MLDVERSPRRSPSRAKAGWAFVPPFGAPGFEPDWHCRALPFRSSLMKKIVDPKVYVRTCLALLILLAVTWAIAYIDLGPLNLIVALAVAITKAIVIALFFMHIKGSSRILHLAAVAGLVWLLILISLTLGDYFTRGWVPLNH
jgi:cytochrome c oxidase subunit 4